MIFFDAWFLAGLFLASVLYWVIPERFRLAFVIGASGAALAAIQPLFTGVLAALIVAVFFLSKQLHEDRRRPGAWLVTTLLLLVSFLLFAKYGKSFLSILFSTENELAKHYLVPLGVSYLSFKLIAFAIDVYRGVIERPRLATLFAFVFFIPTFPAGPIERYQNFESKREPAFDADLYVDGLRRIVLGYFKKIVLVNFLLQEVVFKTLQPTVFADGVSLDLPAGTVLLFLVGSLIYAYLDLSAYADLAIGFGQLFGVRTMENMRYPIFRRNLSDYWAHWHISLSSWCRNNVYFPILGATRRNNLALVASFVVMGLWHNISLNWLLWGCWHAGGIIVYSRWDRWLRKHKPWRKRLKGRAGYAVGMVITVLYSSLGFAFIMTDDKHDLIGATVRALRMLAAIVL